jgi:hypothetical protein
MRLQNQDESALRDHVFSTYITLRWGLTALGVVFPVLLWAVGRIAYGIPLQPSMSNYYFAPYPDNPAETVFPMRVWFVGMLCAIGAGLALYKGFTNWENAALNLAGGFAALVALFPMNIAHQTGFGARIHGTSAILLFGCLAFVSVFCARATLPYLKREDSGLAARLSHAYKWLGALMLLSPLAAFVLTMATNSRSRFIFFAEAIGVWCVAAYWGAKSWEMARSGAELLALQARIRPPRRQTGTVLPRFSTEPREMQAVP